MKTGKEFIESLRNVKSVLYLNGEKVTDFVDHPIVKPSLNSIALVYDLAHDPAYSELMTAESDLIDERVNIKIHIPKSRDDLVKRIHAIRLLQQKSGGVCTQRNCDPLVPPFSVTYDMDKELKTKYHDRYKDFIKHVQKNDLNLNFSITDPKGDRRLRPHEQPDPDLYLRVVEKRKNGIIVRGAKVHQTAAVACHEKLVFPTRTLIENDKDYAVAFAVPSDAKGITHVFGRLPSDQRWFEEGDIDKGVARYCAHTCTVFYDDVFVPWERVFMCGEYAFTTSLIERFGDHHRPTYGGCKAGACDVMVGAAATIAEYNGLTDDKTIKEKLMEMVALGETMFATGLAAAFKGYRTASGAYHPDSLLSNVCKTAISRYPYEIARLAEDIAGGYLFTMPSEKDFRHPDLRARFEKYLKGAGNTKAEEKLRIFSYLSNMIFGTHAVDFQLCCGGGAGSYQASRIMLRRLANLEEKSLLAKIASGIIKE